jgi:hypothetical protein
MGMVMDFMKSLLEENLPTPPEERRMADWANAVTSDNWVLLHKYRMEEELDASGFYMKVAEGYAHAYAAGREPTRNADWSAFKKTLENLHHPLMADATEVSL